MRLDFKASAGIFGRLRVANQQADASCNYWVYGTIASMRLLPATLIMIEPLESIEKRAPERRGICSTMASGKGAVLLVPKGCPACKVGAPAICEGRTLMNCRTSFCSSVVNDRGFAATLLGNAGSLATRSAWACFSSLAMRSFRTAICARDSMISKRICRTSRPAAKSRTLQAPTSMKQIHKTTLSTRSRGLVDSDLLTGAA